MSGCKGVGDKSTGTTTWLDLGIPLGNGDGGPGGGPDMACYKPAFPYILTPLTPAQTQTANISLYFSVTDANNRGVTGLSCGGGGGDMGTAGMGGDMAMGMCATNMSGPQPDCSKYFIDEEDGTLVDPNESHLQVEALSGNNLDIPTVLVLDLSGNIVANGNLPNLQTAANEIIDAMTDEQRLAIVAFADQPSLRIGFTGKKDAGGTGVQLLKAAVANLDKANLGVSSNLNGAMVQALGMWQDNFDPVTTKLTAGMVIVVASGEDMAGVKTFEDVIQARGNKKVIAFGVQSQFSQLDKLRQMATGCGISSTGSDGGVNIGTNSGECDYFPVNGFSQLGSGVQMVTAIIESLAHSIYHAFYCSPKRSGGTSQHTVTFSVVGNPANTISAQCKTATFNGSAPGQCSQIGDGTTTQVCQQTLSGNTSNVICCPPSAPFWCPPDATNPNGSCYYTAEQAQNGDGQRPGCGMQCTECGGTGMVVTGNNTDLTPGPAIHVTFTPNGYTTNQCPYFWPTQDPNCASLNDCCHNGLDPNAKVNGSGTSYAQSCINDLTTATSMSSSAAADSACMTDLAKYCPSPVTTNCMALTTCCKGYPPGPGQDQCYAALYAAYASGSADATCQTQNAKFCPAAGSMCASLKTCCNGLGPGGQQTCLTDMTNATQDSQCTPYINQFCPTGTNCKALAACCAAFGQQEGSSCYSNLSSANGVEGNCMTYEAWYCPTAPNCMKLMTCCSTKPDACPPNTTCVTRYQCEQDVVSGDQSGASADTACASSVTKDGC